MPTLDDKSGEASGFLGEHYQKASEWEAFKKGRGGKANVGECEVRILHLQEEVVRHEKTNLVLQRRVENLQVELDKANQKIHDLDTALKLAQKESDADKALLNQLRRANRLIEVLIGIGCCGFGALPSFYPIIEKGSKTSIAIVATIVMAAVFLCFIFLPTIIIRGEK